jgi:hypothetical protein
VAKGVLHVDDIKASGMTLTVDDGSNTSHVVSSGHEAEVSRVELNEVSDLASVNLEQNDIIGLDGWVGVADGATVMGNKVRNTLGTSSNLLNSAELELI